MTKISKFIFSDIPLPDIFISEYLLSMSENEIKSYLYSLYLIKNKISVSVLTLSKGIKLSDEITKETLDSLVEKDLLYKKSNYYHIKDIKELELNKLYKPRLAPSESDIGKKNSIISTINKKFFQNIMPLSWYTTIETLFNLYKFDDDVMFTLFLYCHERDKLSKGYVEAVSKTWFENGVKNSFDLDKYFDEYGAFRELCKKVARALNRKNAFTKYEEQYILKWVKEYGYSFDIIELALKKTTNISNPNLNYVNKILANWNKMGVKTKAQAQKSKRSYVATDKLSNYQINKLILDHYQEIKDYNSSILEKRKSEVLSTIPKLKKIEEDITDVSIKALSASANDKATLFSDIKSLKQERTDLLAKYNYPKDYLTLQYTCSNCKDTGVKSDGNSCQCRKDLLSDIKNGKSI